MLVRAHQICGRYERPCKQSSETRAHSRECPDPSNTKADSNGVVPCLEVSSHCAWWPTRGRDFDRKCPPCPTASVRRESIGLMNRHPRETTLWRQVAARQTAQPERRRLPYGRRAGRGVSSSCC